MCVSLAPVSPPLSCSPSPAAGGRPHAASGSASDVLYCVHLNVVHCTYICMYVLIEGRIVIHVLPGLKATHVQVSIVHPPPPFPNSRVTLVLYQEYRKLFRVIIFHVK